MKYVVWVAIAALAAVMLVVGARGAVAREGSSTHYESRPMFLYCISCHG